MHSVYVVNKCPSGVKSTGIFVYGVDAVYSLASQLHPNCTHKGSGDSEGSRDHAAALENAPAN